MKVTARYPSDHKHGVAWRTFFPHEGNGGRDGGAVYSVGPGANCLPESPLPLEVEHTSHRRQSVPIVGSCSNPSTSAWFCLKTVSTWAVVQLPISNQSTFGGCPRTTPISS